MTSRNMTIYMTKAKGGVGLTNIAYYVSFCLAKRGIRTLYVDGNTELSLGFCLAGLDDFATFTMRDVNMGICRVQQAVCQHPEQVCLYLLSCLGAEQQKIPQQLAPLRERFDVIICDDIAPTFCERSVLVTTPELPCLKGADLAIGKLKQGAFQKTQVIVSQVSGDLLARGELISPQEISTLLRSELLGITPQDLWLPYGKPLKKSWKAWDLIARSLLSTTPVLYQPPAFYGWEGARRYRMRGKL